MKIKSAFIIFLVCFICFSMLPGCSGDHPAANRTQATHHSEPQSVEHIGILPDAFKTVVANNIFKEVTAFDGRLLTAEILSADQDDRTIVQQVRMMDLYGNDLAAYTCSSDDAYHVTTLTATDDGGFLFVLGFMDYAYGTGEWASDKGFASRVIKCDDSGNLQFDTPFYDVEGAALKYCFEKNGHFYFFGTIQTPETKTQGIHSRTDIYMAILDHNGEILKSHCIAGSDYDSLDTAELSGDCFVLSISSQSDDGDFAGSNSNGYSADWVITVNEDLEITDKKQESGRNYFDFRIGEKNGDAVYTSNALLNDFDAGTPTAFIDYGDFYMIISENITGVYENTPPAISSIWYYTETVYSAYDHNGNLIFRASVDSSPDYDARINEFQIQLNR